MKVKVQIALDGEDAALYNRITNKKQFLIFAMKMFSQDEKLSLAFFNDAENATQPVKAVKAHEEKPSSAVKAMTTPAQGRSEKKW